MTNKILLAILLISNVTSAKSRPELLSICSLEARKSLRANYFPPDSTTHKLLGLTTWLSAENSLSPQQFHFAHIAEVRLQSGKLMNWDFLSITQVDGDSCQLIQQIKRDAYEISPPHNCDNCDDN